LNKRIGNSQPGRLFAGPFFEPLFLDILSPHVDANVPIVGYPFRSA